MTTDADKLKKGPFRVYGSAPFDRSGKVRWLLTELGVDFETKWLDREKGEFESPQFLKLNPMGRIPVLEVGDQAMFESGAINAYLADLFIDRGLAPALTSPLRAPYQQWMHFASATLDVFQIRVMIIEDIPAGEVQEKKLKALQEDLRDALITLDRTVGHSPFLLGDRFSAADIGVSYHLNWFALWPELNCVLKDFPRVEEYIERMKARPSAVKADVFSYKG